MAQDYFSTAFVRVQADPAEFKRTLRATIAEAQKTVKPLKVPIVFTPTAFKKGIQDAIRTAGPFKAKIEPDTSGFRRKLETQLRGIKIPIQIVPVAGPEVRQAIRNIQTAGSAAAREAAGAGPAIPPSIARGAVSLPTPTVLAAPAAASTAASTSSATNRQTAAERELKAQQEARRKLLEGLVVAEQQLNSAMDAGLAPTTALEARTLALESAEKARANVLRQVALEQEGAAKVSVPNLGPLQSLGATLVANARAARSEIEATVRNDAVQKEAASLETQVAEAKQINIKAIATKSELLRVENKLTALSTSLDEAYTAALESQNIALAKNFDALHAEVVALQEVAVAQRKTIASTAESNVSFGQARRGIFATLASFSGLRGAVLASSGPFLAATIAVTTLVKSLQQFAKFQTSLSTFQAVSGATAKQMERVSAVAKQLGADITLPAVSAADAADAMTELAKAGLSVEDALAGTRGVLELATAAQLSNADAATLVANALNAFGLAGAQATHVADVFANAANAAQGSIADIGAAFQQSAAVARQAGISFEDTSALLTIFAKNGLRSSDAGTSLRTALIRLIAPTKQASAFIQELGLHIRDAQGNIRPDIFAQFGKATASLPPALRDFIAATIAGQDAIRAFSIGAREGERGLELVRLQLDQQGTAQAVAAARTKGLGGEFQALTSNLQTTATEFGKLASGPAQKLLGVIDQLTTAVGDLFEGLNKLSSGDFSGAFKALGNPLQPFEESFKAQEDAARRLKAAFTSPDFFAGLKAAPKIAQDVASSFSFGVIPSADATKKKVADLIAELDSLQKIRIEQFQLRLPIGETTKQIAAIRAQLKSLNVLAPETIPLTPIDKALQGVRELVTELQSARKAALQINPQADVSGLNRAIAQLQGRLSTRLKAQIQIETTEADRARLRKSIAALTESAAQGNQAAKIAIEIDQGAISRDNAAIRRLRKQIFDELNGIKEDAKKATTNIDLAHNFLIEFQAIARAPQQLGGTLVKSIGDQIKQIETLGPLSAAEGQKVGQSLLNAINAAMKAAAKANDSDLVAALAAKAQAIADLFGGQLQQAFKNIKVPLTAADITNILLPQETQVAIAQAFGTVGQQIAASQNELTKATAVLQKSGISQKNIEAILSGGLSPSQIRQILQKSGIQGQALTSLLSTIASSKQNVASLTQQEASKAQSAQGKADQAVLDSFSNREQELQNRLIQAQSTKTLQDDLKITRALRDLYASEIKEARVRISDAQKRNSELLTLTGDLAKANQDLITAEVAAFEQRFGTGADRLNRNLATAQARNQLNAELLITISLRNLYKREIAEARKQASEGIITAKVRNQIIKDAQAQIDTINNNLIGLRQQAAQQVAESIQLDIDFANTKGDVSGEIRARERLIAQLKKEQAQVKRTSIEWKTLRNEIATEERAIKDLKAQNDAKADAARALFFSFLQQQQGFAANLFSNLIPGFAKSGLVGGGNGPNIPSAPTIGIPSPVTGPSFGGGIGGPHGSTSVDQARASTKAQTPTTALDKEALSAAAKSGAGGPTSGQSATMIKLLGDIVIALRALNRGNEHPEAKHQRQKGSANMDIMGHL